MVHIVRSLLGAAALLSVSSAVPMPRPDSAIGAEVPVSAPNGTPTSEPASQATGGNYGSDKGSKDSYGGSQGGYDQGGGYNQGGSYNQGGGYNGGYSSSSMMEESSTMMEEMTSTMAAESSYSTPSYSSSASYSMATYGSGSQSWGGSGYNDCVQQCAASYGSPPMTMSPSSTESGSGGSSGSSGATHTIIVAPMQGVLRYIPFSTNASVGDTLEFKWKGGPHFVSRSSALEVCNKTSNNFFTSGKQEAGFTFRESVNDTGAVWFYCSVPGHCQKGMFGGVNIGQADPTGSDSSSNSSSSSSNYVSLSSMMSNMTQMDADMSAMWSYTKNQTGNNAFANGWGMSTNLAGMSQEAMMQTAQNVMYNQMAIAMNPDNVKDGKFVASENMKVPQDLSMALLSSSAGNPSGATGASAGGSPSSASSAASPSATDAPNNAANSNSNGAGSISSSSVAVGLVAVAATFMAL